MRIHLDAVEKVIVTELMASGTPEPEARRRAAELRAVHEGRRCDGVCRFDPRGLGQAGWA